MSKPVEARVRAVAAVNEGYGVFLGNAGKAFVMPVDQGLAATIATFMQGVPKPRPLTHDLLANVLAALGVKVHRLLVIDCKDGTYFATVGLSAENELTKQELIELEARRSDGIAMALPRGASIYVNQEVGDGVQDMPRRFESCKRKAWRPKEARSRAERRFTASG